jgi:hypothetical protein
MHEEAASDLFYPFVDGFIRVVYCFCIRAERSASSIENV